MVIPPTAMVEMVDCTALAVVESHTMESQRVMAPKDLLLSFATKRFPVKTLINSLEIFVLI
jgi:hypothetical protein